jgi:hypothetical protein
MQVMRYDCIMRTTVAVDDELLARAKRRAASRHLTLGQYIEEALRRDLLADDGPRLRVELPVFAGGRVQPGIDVSSNRDLYDALDEEGPLA